MRHGLGVRAFFCASVRLRKTTTGGAMKATIKNSKPSGTHYLISFYGCDERQINSAKFWEKTLFAAAKDAGIPILHNHFYKFNPHGCTGFLLLASSHVSIHTWPEYKYVACDVFSCSSEVETGNLVRHLVEAVTHTSKDIKKMSRGFRFFDFKKHINKHNQLIMPVFSTGGEMKIDVRSILAETKSEYQEILFIDTPIYGKCLVIDGIIQTSEYDHELYDRTMLSLLKAGDKKLLILGGGDGYVAQAALAINPDLCITVVDLDRAVVEGCKLHLNQKVFGDPRIELHIENAVDFLEKTAKKRQRFDGIICDLTDAPMSTHDKKDFLKFYEKVISCCSIALKKNGWISMQAGASHVAFGHIDAVSTLSKLLGKQFKTVSRKDVLISSYGEENTFLFAQATSP